MNQLHPDTTRHSTQAKRIERPTWQHHEYGWKNTLGASTEEAKGGTTEAGIST
jgi:hypothetical protein